MILIECVFWKSVSEIKVLGKKMFLLLDGRDKSTHWKGSLSQAVGGSLLSTVWWGFSLLSGIQRAIPEGNTATLGSSAVKAQVGSSAKKIVFWHWRAACYLSARRHKPWCFFQSSEMHPFSQIVKQWLIAMRFFLLLLWWFLLDALWCL